MRQALVALLFLTTSALATSASEQANELLSRINQDIKESVLVRKQVAELLESPDDTDWADIQARALECGERFEATQKDLKNLLLKADKQLKNDLDVPLHRHAKILAELKVAARRVWYAHATRRELDAIAEREVSGAPPAQVRSCERYYRASLDAEHESGPRKQVLDNAPPLQAVLTSVAAFDLFAFLRDHANIPFYAADSGCFARAHAMAYLLEKKKVFSRKIFLFGELGLKTPWVTEGKVSWWFHVAPLVMVDLSGKGPLEMVFDPSLSACPLTIGQWASMLTSDRCTEVAPRVVQKRDLKPGRCSYFKTERFAYNISADVSNEHEWLGKHFAATGVEFEAHRKLQARLIRARSKKRR